VERKPIRGLGRRAPNKVQGQRPTGVMGRNPPKAEKLLTFAPLMETANLLHFLSIYKLGKTEF